MRTVLRGAVFALLMMSCALARDVTIAATVCSGANALVTFTRLSQSGVQQQEWTTWYSAGALSVVLTSNEDGSRYRVWTACQGSTPSTKTAYWLVPDAAGPLTPTAVTVDESVRIGPWYWSTTDGIWKNVASGISAGEGSGYVAGDHASLGSVTVTPLEDRQAFTGRCHLNGQNMPVLELQREGNSPLRADYCGGYSDMFAVAEAPPAPTTGFRAYWKVGSGMCWKIADGTETCAGEAGAGTPGGAEGDAQFNIGGELGGRKLQRFILDEANAWPDPAFFVFWEHTGASQPAATACDEAAEVGRLAWSSGSPAAVAVGAQVCLQVGASSYAWQPLGYRIGTTAPATCTVGQMFVDTDATAGSNVYVGTGSPCTWTLQGGTSSTGSKMLFVRGQQTADTLDTTDKVIGGATVSIPGGTIPVTGGCLSVRVAFQHTTGTGSVNFKLNYGTYAITRSTTSVAQAGLHYHLCFESGAPTAITGTSWPDSFGGTASAPTTTTGTIDSAATQTLSFTAAGAATEAVTLRQFTVEVLR